MRGCDPVQGGQRCSHERVEKIQTVAGAEGLGPRCRLSGRAEVVHQVARRERHAAELSLSAFRSAR